MRSSGEGLGLSGRCPETAAGERWPPRPSLSLCCSLSLRAVEEKKKKKLTFSSVFNSSKHDTGREYLQRSPTWPNLGKIWSSQFWEASHYPLCDSFPPATAYTCQSDLSTSWPRRWSHRGLLDREASEFFP